MNASHFPRYVRFLIFSGTFATILFAQQGPSNLVELRILLADIFSVDPSIQRKAEQSLLRLGTPSSPPDTGVTVRLEKSPTVVPALLSAISARELERPSPNVEAAYRTLKGFGLISVPALKVALNDPNTAKTAAIALGNLGFVAASARANLEVLAESDNAAGIEAIRALGKLGWTANMAVPHLLRLKVSGSEERRREAAKAISLISPSK